MHPSYDARMGKELTYLITSRVAGPIGRQLRSTNALAAKPLDPAVEWFPMPAAANSEDSNPCRGIAVGCGLSLVVWGGLLVLFYLLR